MVKKLDNEMGEQAINMNGPTERVFQERPMSCKNFVSYCPFYRPFNYQNSVRIRPPNSRIYRL